MGFCSFNFDLTGNRRLAQEVADRKRYPREHSESTHR
jgi:hypothetical protein